MMELEVVLDFTCRNCGRPMGVTLKCEGKGLAAGGKALASVKVPCPACGGFNQLFFEPNGTLHHVTAHREPRPVPVPSIN